jgi:hypothetical protein
LGETEVVVGNDDRALALGEKRQEASGLESVKDGIELVRGGSFLLSPKREKVPASTPRSAKCHAEEPAGHVDAARWRLPQSLGEGLMQRVLS